MVGILESLVLISYLVFMINMAAAKKQKKKGTAYIVKGNSEAPGGDCKSKDCPIKAAINPGMTLVTCDDKTYHASCAIREGVEFKVPSVPKSKRVD